MTTEEARQIIGMGGNTSAEGLQEMFRQRFQELESKLERAPTPSLKEKYRRGLTQLEEAWEVLSGTETMGAEVNYPAMHPVVERESTSTEPFQQSESKKQKAAAQLIDNGLKMHKQSARLLFWLCTPYALLALAWAFLFTVSVFIRGPDHIWTSYSYEHGDNIFIPFSFLVCFFAFEMWVILAFFSGATNAAGLRPHIVWRLLLGISILVAIMVAGVLVDIYSAPAFGREMYLVTDIWALFMVAMGITVLIIAGRRSCDPILLIPHSRKVPNILVVAGICSCLAVLFAVFTMFC